MPGGGAARHFLSAGGGLLPPGYAAEGSGSIPFFNKKIILFLGNPTNLQKPEKIPSKNPLRGDF